MTNLSDGIWSIKSADGAIATTLAVQVRGGKARPVALTDSGKWGYRRAEFSALSEAQVAALVSNGLSDNQSLAWHTAE